MVVVLIYSFDVFIADKRDEFREIVQRSIN